MSIQASYDCDAPSPDLYVLGYSHASGHAPAWLNGWPWLPGMREQGGRRLIFACVGDSQVEQLVWVHGSDLDNPEREGFPLVPCLLFDALEPVPDLLDLMTLGAAKALEVLP